MGLARLECWILGLPRVCADAVSARLGGRLALDQHALADIDPSDMRAKRFHTFDQAVTFTGSGALDLGQSRMFTQTVTGFSTRGKTTLDLEDIRFVDAGEATFSGTASGGVLNVTDGAHTAHITLKGDYRGVTFVASKDGAGRTQVVAQKAMAFAAPVDAFISAMAGLGSPGGQAIHTHVAWLGREYLLAPARAALAYARAR
jgi:hypothetical protein